MKDLTLDDIARLNDALDHLGAAIAAAADHLDHMETAMPSTPVPPVSLQAALSQIHAMREAQAALEARLGRADREIRALRALNAALGRQVDRARKDSAAVERSAIARLELREADLLAAHEALVALADGGRA